jgi:hypothetical protein
MTPTYNLHLRPTLSVSLVYDRIRRPRPVRVRHVLCFSLSIPKAQAVMQIACFNGFGK